MDIIKLIYLLNLFYLVRCCLFQDNLKCHYFYKLPTWPTILSAYLAYYTICLLGLLYYLPTRPTILSAYMYILSIKYVHVYNLIIIPPFSVLGCAYSASVVCTNYAVGGGGGDLGAHGYYVRPVPGNCRAQHMGNWKPTFRIVSIRL